MFKKVFIAIVLLGCMVLLYVAYFFLKDEVQKHRSPVESVPVDAAVLIESNNIQTVWSRLSETNLVWSVLTEIPSVKEIDDVVRSVDSLLSTKEKLENLLHNKKVVFSFHPNGESVEMFGSTTCSEEQYIAFKELIVEHGITVKNGEGTQHINQVEFSKGKYNFTYHSPFLLFSSSKQLIESSIVQINKKESLLTNPDFLRLKSTTHNSSALNCFVNFSQLGRVMTPYLQKEVAESWLSEKLFPEWAEFDLMLKSDALILSGLSTMGSKNEFLNRVSKQKANHSVLQPNFPNSIKSLIRAALDNPKIFVAEVNSPYLDKIKEKCSCDPVETISSWMGNEMVLLEFSRTRKSSLPVTALVVETNGTENVLGRLAGFGVEDSVWEEVYGVEIYKVDEDEFLTLFGEEFIPKGEVYFSQIMGYAVFSSREGISKLAYQWNKEATVVQQSDFLNFANQLMANFSSADYYALVSNFTNKSEQYLKNEYFLKIQKYSDAFKKLGSIAWQTGLSENDLQYHTIALNVNQGNKNNSNSLWSLKLKTNVIRAPELMKNHRTNTLEVLLQDENNAIHLIGATGKIKWSKNLEGPIIGAVKQIDVYANNKYQMLFNTSSKIHLIDINGNEVGGYPIALKAPATNSVCALDYENKRDYRILIACSDKKIYNYNQLGEIVEGWKFAGSDQIIVNEAKHFVTDGKDYILFTDLGGTVYFLDRKGNKRVSLTSKITTRIFESIDFQKGKSFTTSVIRYQDTSGKICELMFNDANNCFNLDTVKEYRLNINDIDNDGLKEYLVSHKNRFEVYGIDKELIHYETFEFNINNEIEILGDGGNKYIVVGNEGEIYLYNHKYSLLSDFPVQGSKLATVGDINNDGKINLVTIDNSNELKVYSLTAAGSL